MTNDQTIDADKLDKAREWAERIKATASTVMPPGTEWISEQAKAASDVILSSPEEVVDGGKVRELIEAYELARDGNAEHSEAWLFNHLVVNNLVALLPEPPRPTMASVEWSDKEHQFTGALTARYGEIVMLAPEGDYIRCYFPNFTNGHFAFDLMWAGDLIPTGRKHKLVPDNGHYDDEGKPIPHVHWARNPEEQVLMKQVMKTFIDGFDAKWPPLDETHRPNPEDNQ